MPVGVLPVKHYIFISSYKACATTMTATTTSRRIRRSAFTLDQERTSQVANLAACAAAVIACPAIRRRLLRRRMRRHGGSAPGRLPFRRRHRKSVWDVYNEVGEHYFRRAYRMTVATFMHLATILRPYISAASGKSGTPRYSPNGPISPDVRLACAIRWFAGGSFYDIMTTIRTARPSAARK